MSGENNIRKTDLLSSDTPDPSLRPRVDLRMRPRFVGAVPGPPGQFLAALQSALEHSEDARGTVFESSAVLKVMERDRHFWSPQLHLSLEPEDDQTTVRGRFSPHPSVWSGFLALYLAIAFIGIIGVIFGSSQWTLGATPTGLLAGPVSIVLTALVYAAARFGRWLGHDQMRELSLFLSESTAFQETEPTHE